MTDVTNQRRMAAAILKCGLNRVYMPPDKEKLQEISEATTRAMVRSLIVRRYIRKLPARGVSRGRARLAHGQRVKGRRRGAGSRRGLSGARSNPKTRWISNIRAIRRTLKSLRDQEKITTVQYRAYYRMAKGGQFHNKAHLLSQMEARGDIKTVPGGKHIDMKNVPLKGVAPKAAAPKKPAKADLTKPGGVKPAAKPAPKEEPKKGLLGRKRTKEE